MMGAADIADAKGCELAACAVAWPVWVAGVRTEAGRQRNRSPMPGSSRTKVVRERDARSLGCLSDVLLLRGDGNRG